MAVKIRLARGGAKKAPYYRVVVANATAPRDGDFLEKVGTYNPMLSAQDPNRITLKSDRVLYWLSQGAQPSDRVAKFISSAGIALPEHIKKKIAVKNKGYEILAAKKREADAVKAAEDAAVKAAEEAAAKAKASEEAEAAKIKAAEEAATKAADEAAAKAAEENIPNVDLTDEASVVAEENIPNIDLTEDTEEAAEEEKAAE